MSELNELQEHRKALQEMIDKGNRLKLLKANPLFEEFIEKGFCTEEMKRTLGLAMSERLKFEDRELCNQMAKAGAALQNYLNFIAQRASMAEQDLEATNNAIEELEAKGEE